MENFAMAERMRLIVREERNFVETVDATFCRFGSPTEKE
jgi:hypothetical protein